MPQTSNLRQFVRSFADLLFPPVCFGCDRQIQDGLICDKCSADLFAGRTGVCVKCGRPVTRKEELKCGSCGPFAPERVRALGPYVPPFSGAVQALKYSGKTSLARLLGEALVRLVDSDPVLARTDCICAVPLHPARMRERGYNQAAMLAAEVAKGVGIGFRDLLVRRKNTKTQTRMLTNDERSRNLKGAFVTRPGSDLTGLRVLLVDDVLTSGATMDSASRQLLKGGAKAVVGIAVAAA